MKQVYVDEDLCNGCRICELRCSFEHYTIYGPSYARIHIHKDEYNGIAIPKVCKQCKNAYCLNACPEGAITKKDGIINVNEELCTGCGLCKEACPFDAIVLHPKTKYSLICDTCDGSPQCVKYCPENALLFMNREEFKQYKLDKK